MTGVVRMLPPEDGRVQQLPVAAVNLAARVTQLAHERRQQVVTLQVLVVEGALYLLLPDGKNEQMGRIY